MTGPAVSDYREAEQALQQLRTKNDQLLERNQTLLAQRDALLRESAEQDGPFENMDELNQAQLLAGLTDVEGDGVVVILRDKSDLDLQKDSALAIVHKETLEYVVALLIDHGANAVSVSGQRLTNASSFQCIGPTILFNETRLTPPYIIQAIGPPNEMENSLITDSVIRQISGKNGIEMTVEVLQDQLITAFERADDYERYIHLLEEAK